MGLKTKLLNMPEDITQVENRELLIEEMLEQIGSTDAELRDQLIYQKFCDLILGDHVPNEKLKEIGLKCIGEQHLLYRLGENDTDAVFTRSFSALVIVLILMKDKERGFLSSSEWKDIYDATVHYLKEEKDVRGYVEGKGWAHSIAHGADLLTAVVEHPTYKQELFQECLDTIACCLLRENVYTDDEDERLIFAIEAMMEKGLTEERVVGWVNDLMESINKAELFSLTYFKYRRNVGSFIKSLYFRLSYKGVSTAGKEDILSLMHRFHVEVYK